jgi:hypothetical protein
MPYEEYVQHFEENFRRKMKTYGRRAAREAATKMLEALLLSKQERDELVDAFEEAYKLVFMVEDEE